MANVGAFVHSIRATEYVWCVKQEKVYVQGTQNNGEKVHKTTTGRYTKQDFNIFSLPPFSLDVITISLYPSPLILAITLAIGVKRE